jgi:hypothetical protein
MAAWSQLKLALPGTDKRRQIAGLTTSSVILIWYVGGAGATPGLEARLAFGPFFEDDLIFTASQRWSLPLEL